MNAGLKAFLLGDRNRISGTVYGTIIVMSVIAAGAKPYQHHLWRLLVLVGVSVIVLWLAHVYSHGLGESLRLRRRLSLAELRSIARREYSIVASAVGPLLCLLLGVLGAITARTSISLALWIGVLALTVQGVRYAQLERLTRSGALVTVAVNTAIGLGLVALEVLIAH